MATENDTEECRQPDAAEQVARENASQEQPAPEESEEAAEREPDTVQLPYSEYEELKTLARERDDYLKRLQRAVADYQNLQKRQEKLRLLARDEQLRKLGEAILPVADSLSRALQAAEETEGAETLVEGLRLVEKEFYGALARLGIEPIEALGQPFDPHYHEAIMQQNDARAPANTVVHELKKGFMLGEQVIRPSHVIVAGGSGGDQQGRTGDEDEGAPGNEASGIDRGADSD